MKPKTLASTRLRGKNKHMDAPLPPTAVIQSAPTAKWGDKIHHKGISAVLIVIGSILFLGVNIGAYYFGRQNSGRKLDFATLMNKSSDGSEQDGQKSIFNFFNKDKVLISQSTNFYACDPNGVCNTYADPASMGCPKTFRDPYCSNKCKDPKVQCTF